MERYLEDPIVEIRRRIGKRNEKTGLNVTHLTLLCAKHLYIYIIQDIKIICNDCEDSMSTHWCIQCTISLCKYNSNLSILFS